MHNIYNVKGKYDFIFQIPQILYSTIICSSINLIVKYLSLSEKDILKFKNDQSYDSLNSKKVNLIRILIVKFNWYFKISFVLLIFFWYYLSCFGVIFKNTQIYLIKDTTISYGMQIFYPFCIYSITGIFRIISLKKKNQKCLYKISKIIQII